MSDRSKSETETREANEAISRGGKRQPGEAAAGKISPAVPPAGAAILADTDPALDAESETEAKLDRAADRNDRKRDRMTGEE